MIFLFWFGSGAISWIVMYWFVTRTLDTTARLTRFEWMMLLMMFSLAGYIGIVMALVLSIVCTIDYFVENKRDWWNRKV